MSRYDVEKFVPQPDQELVCCICKNVLDEPMESPCRHVFCKICIETWLNNSKTCPTCRFTVTNGDLKTVLPLVRNMLNKLTLRCDFSDNGCKDLILLEKYQKHIKACDYEKVVCRYPKCAACILRMLIKTHEEKECKYREILCKKDCGIKIAINSVETHDCIKALKALCQKKDKDYDILAGENLELKNIIVQLNKDAMKSKQEVIRQRNNSWETSSSSSQDSEYSEINWHRYRSPSRSRSRSHSRSRLPLHHFLSSGSSSRSRSRTRSRSRSRSRSLSGTSTRSRSSTRHSSYSTSPRRSLYSSGSSVDSFPLRQRDRDEQEAILNSINLVSDNISLIRRNLNGAQDLLMTVNNPVPIVRCVQCAELQENCQCDHYSVVHSEAERSDTGAYSEGPSLTSFTEEGHFSSGNENLDQNSSDDNVTVEDSPQSRRGRSSSEEHSNDSYSPTAVEGQTISVSYNPTPLNQSPASSSDHSQRSGNLSSQNRDKIAQIPLVVDMNSWSAPVNTVNTIDPSYSPKSHSRSSSSSSASEHRRSRSPVCNQDYYASSSDSEITSPDDRSARHSSRSPGPSYSPSPYRTYNSSCYSSPHNSSQTWSRKRKRSKSPNDSPSSTRSSPHSSVSGPCYRESDRTDTDHKRYSYDSFSAQKKQRTHSDASYSPSDWSPRHDFNYNSTALSKSKYKFKINEGASTSSQQSDYAKNQHHYHNSYNKDTSNEDTDNERSRMLKKSKKNGSGKKRKRSKRKSYSSENDFSGNEQEHGNTTAFKPKLKSVVGLYTPTKPNIEIKFIVRKANGELMSSESSEDSN